RPALPLDTLDVEELTAAAFDACKTQILTVEHERYGSGGASAEEPGGTHPSLEFPLETLENTMGNPGALAAILRDRVSGRLVGYALGSMLENHDEEGVASDPHFSENNTFYLQALAVVPSAQNATQLENLLLDTLYRRAAGAGFQYLSTLIEARLRETGPVWLREASVLA